MMQQGNRALSLHLGDSPDKHEPLACSSLVRRLSYESVNPANKSTAKKKEAPAVKIAAQNRAASYNYELLDRFEAGMVLVGTEVKTLREGKGALRDAYAEIKGGEVWLMNCHIPEYRPGGPWNHGPLRARKLLLNRREINKLSGQVQQKGLTLIPLKIYFRDGMAKCELALARGKKFWDRRRAEREKEDKREAREAMHRYKRL
jgi:SsrA-binding protein